MAVYDAEGFANLCNIAKEALANKKPAEAVVENVVFLKPLPKKN